MARLKRLLLILCCWGLINQVERVASAGKYFAVFCFLLFIYSNTDTFKFDINNLVERAVLF